MKDSNYFTILFVSLFSSVYAQQHLDVEGDIKLDNTIHFFDRTSGTPIKMATISGNYPAGAGSANSPTLVLKTETSPIQTNGAADIILDSSDDIIFNTNAITRMHVSGGGRVGVGTIVPSDLFHVKGDAIVGGGSADFDLTSENIRIDGQSEQWYMGVQNEATSGATDFFIGKSGTEDGTFHIEQTGDVGIGTTNPTESLQVLGDGIFGGGGSEYDSNSEYLRIFGRSESWVMGVQNEASESSSDFLLANRLWKMGPFILNKQEMWVLGLQTRG